MTLSHGLPLSFPMPARCTPLLDESVGEVVRWRFSGIERDVRAHFESVLSSDGWTILAVDASEGEVTLEIEGHGYMGQVEIGPLEFTVQLVR